VASMLDNYAAVIESSVLLIRKRSSFLIIESVFSRLLRNRCYCSSSVALEIASVRGALVLEDVSLVE
jgi:hypothetical protein